MNIFFGSDRAELCAMAAGFNFSDIGEDNKIVKNFTNDAPRWRKVTKGLNLEAICKTNGCDAKGKRVWVQMGFGEFDVVEAIYQGTLCPLCKKDTEDADNMGFTGCNFEVDGKKRVDGHASTVSYFDHAPAGKLTTFKRENVDWRYLKIKTTRI